MSVPLSELLAANQDLRFPNEQNNTSPLKYCFKRGSYLKCILIIRSYNMSNENLGKGQYEQNMSRGQAEEIKSGQRETCAKYCPLNAVQVFPKLVRAKELHKRPPSYFMWLR